MVAKLSGAGALCGVVVVAVAAMMPVDEVLGVADRGENSDDGERVRAPPLREL